MDRVSIQKRIEAYSIPEPNTGCWLWTRSDDGRKGYGKLFLDGKMRGAHRVSYEAFISKVPSGHDVMHRCDVPSCVNPAHLSTGTHADNLRDCRDKRRLGNQKKNQCKNGHQLMGTNLYTDPRGYRECVTCRKAASVRHQEVHLGK